MSVKIFGIEKGSIAEEVGLKIGDVLISINNNEINDFLDYDFYKKDTLIVLEIKLKDNLKIYYIEIEKDEDEDLGLTFESYMIDVKHSCTNKCIFCFIDQMPKGMRKSLYFKDDDERMSFLFGNYITMTNMKQSEVDRIIKMKISPINISVHSTDSAIRKMMLGNRFSDRTLNYLKQLNEAGIKINCQIVLCPGINDGVHLEKTINDLLELKNSIKSIAVVPVGLTKFRDNLYELTAFDKESASYTIDLIHNISDRLEKEIKQRIVYPSDEFFLLSEREIPNYEYYGDFSQLDNGVGMLRLLEDEFVSALNEYDGIYDIKKNISIITGEAAYNLIKKLSQYCMNRFKDIKIKVHCIKNNFFAGNVIVSGLITGTDILDQLKAHNVYENTLIPAVITRYGENKFLDDYTIEDIEKALDTRINTVTNDGYELFEKMISED